MASLILGRFRWKILVLEEGDYFIPVVESAQQFFPALFPISQVLGVSPDASSAEIKKAYCMGRGINHKPPQI